MDESPEPIMDTVSMRAAMDKIKDNGVPASNNSSSFFMVTNSQFPGWLSNFIKEDILLKFKTSILQKYFFRSQRTSIILKEW